MMMSIGTIHKKGKANIHSIKKVPVMAHSTQVLIRNSYWRHKQKDEQSKKCSIT